MSTVATIRFNHLPTPLVVSVFYDGYPESILHVIADFIASKKDDANSFAEIYQNHQGMTSHESWAIGEEKSAEWEYLIDNGCLICSWKHERSFKEICSPFHYLDIITDEFKPKVAREINKAIINLTNLGIAVYQPQDKISPTTNMAKLSNDFF